jgi:hypothetical protein
MKKALLVLLSLPLFYVAWWHVSFLLVFVARGDTINRGLYSQYVRQFLFGPGLEIPSFIQLFAIFFTLITALGIWLTIFIRHRNRRGAAAS